MSEEPRGGGGDASIAEAGWYLETAAEGGTRTLQRWRIHTLPFRIGRKKDLELVLPADSVSKTHAEIYAAGSSLRLRDLRSRNGTFLNREQIEDAALADGDVLHFADYEFRLGRSDAAAPSPGGERPTTVAHKGPRSHRFEEGTRELRELLRDGQVTMVFQPIVLLSRGTVAAYEALGRSRHPLLNKGPTELLRIAKSIDREAELSRLFRRKAVELAVQRPELPTTTIFLNTHPSELSQRGLIESLDELREVAPTLDLALEIHESVLTSPSTIAELRRWLAERNIALAYDDFGAGQARLHELAEAPPHYLKFDQRFVKDLHQASENKRRMLRSLLAFAAREFSPPIKTVAEGIESEAELRACAEIGFTYGQGFYLGYPRAIEEM